MDIFDSFEQEEFDEGSNETQSETPFSQQQGPSERWKTGDEIGDSYRIYHTIGGPGTSGTSIVYLSYNRKLKGAFAIKTFQDRFLKDSIFVEAFKWAVGDWVMLDKHHNIIWARDADVFHDEESDADRPYVFLEYLMADKRYGPNLASWIDGGWLSLPLILNFAIQFCHGMIYADKKYRQMGKQFSHGNIEPSNIMITREKIIKITNFGLGKAFAEYNGYISPASSKDSAHQRLGFTKSGNIIGTPAYMSPEQCLGEKDIDLRSDVYSFGCVLYEMVTSRHPFQANSLSEYIFNHLKTVPKIPDTNEEFATVIMKCLEKDPRRRYQNFNELEKVLSEIYLRITGEVVNQPDDTPLKAWELNNKFIALNNLGFYEEAYNCLVQALRADPDYASTHVNLAIFYEEQDKLDDAIRELREVSRLYPDDGSAPFRMGVIYRMQGMYEEAIREYQEALKRDPNDNASHDNLAIIYEDQGRIDDAIKEYEEALRIYPDDADTFNSALAGLYFRQGERDESINSYKKCLKLEPEYAEAHFKMGNIYLSQGKFEEAMESYKEVIRLAPLDIFNASLADEIGEKYPQLKQEILEEERISRLFPKEWLQKQLTVQEAQSLLSLHSQPWDKLFAKMEDGDELWTFYNGRAAWHALAGRMGIVLLRNGELIDEIVTAMN